MMAGFRAVDFWLCVAALVLMISVNADRWRAMDPPDRLVRVGFVTLLAAAAYGFGVIPTSPTMVVLRYLLFTASLLQLVIALTWMAVRQFRRRHHTAQHHD